MCKFHQLLCVILLISVCLLGMHVEEVFAQPEVLPIIIPNVHTISIGKEAQKITIIARVDREVQFSWTLDGPGNLEGDLTSREVVYIPPNELEIESAKAIIRVEVTDFRGNSATESVTFTLQAPLPTPTPALSPTPIDIETPTPVITSPTPTSPSGTDLLSDSHQKRIYAIIIGIGNYLDERIPPLPFAENDAQGFYDVLIDDRYGKIPHEQVKLLLSQDATYRNIKNIIGTWARRQATEQDSVIIYYVGYTAFEDEEFYLVTYEADSQDLYSTSFNSNEIFDMLNRIRTKNVITFLDSYHTSTFSSEQAASEHQNDIPWQIFNGEGRVMMSANDGKTSSLVLQNEQQGIFTYHLVRGLQGHADENFDESITLDEIWNYLNRQIINVSQKTGELQTPKLQGNPNQFSLKFQVKNTQQEEQDSEFQTRKDRIIEIYRTGEITVEQFKKALDLLENHESDQILEDFLHEKIPLELFKEIF